MSILAAQWIKTNLIRQENEINYKLMLLNKKLTDLQQYSANIGSGTLSMNSILNVPSSTFNRALAFMNYSARGAMMGAQYNMQLMAPQINMQLQQIQQTNQNNPQMVEMYKKWVMNNLYKQELEKYQKQETKLLNQQEQEIQQEKTRLSTQVQIIKTRIESCDKMQQDSLQRLRA